MADDQVLTRDDSLLSRPTIEPPMVRELLTGRFGTSEPDVLCRCLHKKRQAGVEDLSRLGIAPATERAYRAAGGSSDPERGF
jgi:hypothetical protein